MTKYNKQTLFSELKKELFPLKFVGEAGAKQISGLDTLIAEAEKRDVKVDDLAYILATVYHETAFTMQPIKEYGGLAYLKAKPYWPYYGRGYVQLTWEDNYEKASKKYDQDFVANPDLALVPQYAVQILFDGMKDGWFTGKDLGDYIDNVVETDEEDLKEFKGARKIINGTDKDATIALYALRFRKALMAASITNTEPITKAPEVPVGGVVVAAGGLVLIEPVTALANAIATQKDLFASGSLWKLAIGLLIVSGALFTLYVRWDAAGRPNLFKKSNKVG